MNLMLSLLVAVKILLSHRRLIYIFSVLNRMPDNKKFNVLPYMLQANSMKNSGPVAE